MHTRKFCDKLKQISSHLEKGFKGTEQSKKLMLKFLKNTFFLQNFITKIGEKYVEQESLCTIYWLKNTKQRFRCKIHITLQRSRVAILLNHAFHCFFLQLHVSNYSSFTIRISTQSKFFNSHTFSPLLWINDFLA